MKLIVNKHSIELQKEELVNEGEYNVQKCLFEFSQEYNTLTKYATFTNCNGSYKVVVVNNQCDIPIEILRDRETFTLGVYGYYAEDYELKIRYSPIPVQITMERGSYVEDAMNTEKPTPTDLEQLQTQVTNNRNDIDTLKEKCINYDSEIEEIQQDIVEINGRIDTVVSEIDAKIESINNDISRIDGEQETQNTNIQNNTNAISEINGEIETINTNLGTINSNIQTIEGNISTLESTTQSQGQSISALETNLSSEITNRENGDIYLQEQIDGIVASSDVKDIVGTYQELLDYDTSKLGNNDIIKVLQDNTHEDAMTYYRWLTASSEFEYIGQEGPYYTKSEIDTTLQPYVKNTDYATNDKAGVVKTSGNFGSSMSNDGIIRSVVDTYETYQGKSNLGFISKGTLENVITGKGLVSNTDYATENEAGVVKVSFGAELNANGVLRARPLNYATYNTVNEYNFISKGTLENVIAGKQLIDKPTLDLDQERQDLKTNEIDSLTNDMLNVIERETTTGTSSLEYTKAKEFRLFNCEYQGNVEQFQGEIEGQQVPNPEYPQEVQTLKGYNLIKLTNCETNQFKVENNKITSLSTTTNFKYTNFLYSDGTLHRGSSNYSGLEPNKLERIYCNLQTGSYYFSADISSNVYLRLVDKEYANENYTFDSTPSANKKEIFPNNSFTIDHEMCLFVIFTLASTTFKITELQLKKGTKKPYLPYNAIGIKRVGKNLFDKDSVLTNVELVSATGLTKSSSGYWVSDYIRVKPNTDYYISGKSSQGTSNCFYDKNKNFIQTISLREGKITTPNNENVYYMRLNSPNSNLETTMFELGSVQTDYEPYQEIIDYIDLQGNELLSTDKVVVDIKGNVKLVKNWGKVVLDGSEVGWTKIGNGYQLGVVYPSDGNIFSPTTKAYCDYFKYQYYASGITTNQKNGEFGWNSHKYLTLRIDSITDIILFKQWLSENKPIIYYQLATPIEIDLGTIEPIRTLEGTNNVEVLATLEPTFMSETYAYDLRKELETTEWQFFKAVMGTSSNALPTTWSELLITSNVGGEKSSIDIYKEQLVAGDNDVISPGYYLSANSNLAVVFNINTTNNTINLKTANFNGSNVALTSQYRIYYR